jgi:hypothetical protein
MGGYADHSSPTVTAARIEEIRAALKQILAGDLYDLASTPVMRELEEAYQDLAPANRFDDPRWLVVLTRNLGELSYAVDSDDADMDVRRSAISLAAQALKLAQTAAEASQQRKEDEHNQDDGFFDEPPF